MSVQGFKILLKILHHPLEHRQYVTTQLLKAL